MHSELIRRSIIWLSNIATQKGIRSCPELTLGEGYVADAGAIMNLQWGWTKKFGCNWSDEGDDFTFVMEAKVSRSDFRKTFIKDDHLGSRLKPIANFHFLVVAKGVLPTHLSDEIAIDGVPSFWGVLEESRNGLRLIKIPTYCQSPSMSLHEFGYRILRYSSFNKFAMLDLREECISNDDAEEQKELGFGDAS